MARESLPLLACACASLRRTARVVTQLYETELQGTGLRATQFTLLQALEQLGAASQGALGRLLALDATTLSRTLPPLERAGWIRAAAGRDRKSTRLNSSHSQISYAVFCLKKKTDIWRRPKTSTDLPAHGARP